jgi:hypothetical protein
MKAVNMQSFCVALVLSLGLVPAAHAQETEWMQVDIVNVVPNRLDDYVELQLEEVNPALQRAGVPWRSVWRVAEFGNSYELQLVTPMSSLAQYDTGGALARVLEPDRRLRLVDRLRRMTVSRKRYAIRYRPDVSVEADEVGGLSLARVTTVEIAPGRAADWERFMLKALPTFSGASLVFGVYERVFGPGAASWLIVENYSSFAQLEQPSLLVRAFGEEADAASARVAGVVTSIERTVLRYDAELSYSAIPVSRR